jgi:hypothetical protein
MNFLAMSLRRMKTTPSCSLAQAMNSVTGDARVQTDRHYAAAVVAIVQQLLNGALCDLDEVGRGGEAGAHDVAAVIDNQGVGHHQVRLAIDEGPVRQILAVVVGVVEEATIGDQQLAGVG